MQHGLRGLTGDPVTAARVERANEVLATARWLSVGSLIPMIGWLYGIGLVWFDEQFTKRQKVIATLAFPGGWFGAFVAAWLITRESSGYCFSASFGEAGANGDLAVDSGCVQTGAFPPVLGIALLVVVVVSAALGPAYIRRKGLQQIG